jgi:hypothetical protein
MQYVQTIIPAITLVLNIFILLQYLKYRRRMAHNIERINKDLKDLYEDALETKKQISNTLSEHILTLKKVQKVYQAFYAISLCSKYAIRQSISDILESEEDLDRKKVIVIFFKNLMEEYTMFIRALEERMETIDDSIEKKRMEAVLKEMNDIVTVLSTVSEDSSEEYLLQIFNELNFGVDKIREV